ncbi:hypothetical protein Hypma_005279 [Hypsizygus marmoreus]|uniref:CBM1 domain-containing protein n=1 Tax=Hypsizygus marmoreus TaxID=39966 RepID=A0A369K207_HYPMA|nr:hypothetical protein Hypma_005279 [Hypsizygus marmoreus]
MLGLKVLATVLITVSAVLPSVRASVVPVEKREDYHWIDTWTNMPQLVEQNNLPPAPFLQANSVFRDVTLRQTLRMTVGSEKIRIVFSNVFGGTDLPITAASVAFPTGGNAGASGIQTNTIRPVTFNGGSASVIVPRGKTYTSDEFAFPIQAQQVLAITIYLQQGQSGINIDGHPGSRTTSWMQQGNHVNDASVSGGSTLHWYFLNAVQVYVPTTSNSLMILGDSITDGRGSDNDANNRWPDLLLNRLKASGLTQIAIGNQAAGGNRVLADGLGPSLISRCKRDALERPGVKWVMVFEGVNDIGTAAANTATQTQVANQLINAFKQIASDAKKAGLQVFAATILPFSAPGGTSQQPYSDPTREAARKTVNNWILTSGTFDAVIDFDKFLRNPSTPTQLAGQYNSGDYLHPNVAGYTELASQFPLDIFKVGSGPVPTSSPPPSTTQPPTETTPPPATTTAPSGPIQTHFGQCGGKGFTGPTTCEPPYTCQFSNDWYSQCL